RACPEAVRSRYRSYAQCLPQELSDADYVEIGPVGGGYGRRYYRGSIYVGVAEALNEMADSYASLEWSRFEREWGGAPAPTGPRGTPAQRPESPAAPAPTRQGGEGPEPLPTPPAATPAPVHQADKPSAQPASTPIAEADQVRCRRSCNLRYRACLARCRDQPVTGGGYDACSYECSDSSLSCRGACGGALASP